MSRDPSRSRTALFVTLWTTVWLIAGAVNLTQAIWFSGGTDLPASLGDGRFNNLVLEHGFRSWEGDYTWSSPGQFYPIANTLGWSDSHLGTLPIYIAGRLAGLGPERAMQLWFVVCAGLNLVTGAALLRALRLNRWLLGPIALAAFAGPPAVWLAGTHPQLLPFFPGLWASLQCVRFLEDRRLWRCGVALGAFAWQFAAGPYLAFFFGLLLGFAAIPTWLTRSRSATTPPPVPTPRHGSVYALSALALVGAILGGLNLWVYLGAMGNGVERPMIEVIDLAPSWSSWFSAPPSHAFYPVGWPGGSREHSEHVLFTGFLPWILTPLAIRLGWKHREKTAGRWAFVAGTTAIALVLFTIKWPNSSSAWLTCAQSIEPLRAFRAIGRIALVTHGLMIVSAGLGASVFYARNEQRITSLGATSALLVGALVLEGASTGQPHYSIAHAVARRDAIVTAWREAGDRPILAYAPGFTNQNGPELQLDAWAAALSRRRSTLNGYTGGAPASHLTFIWNPTLENAQALCAFVGIDPNLVSIVTTLPPKTAANLNYVYFPKRVLPPLEDIALEPIDWTLFAPIERFVLGDQVFYQFTPPAEILFWVPDGARQVSFLTGGRPGSYDNGGNSDGYEMTWTLTSSDQIELGSWNELINPRDVPTDRGFLPRTLNLPEGNHRVLRLQVGPGPAGRGDYDWPLLGHLQVH